MGGKRLLLAIVGTAAIGAVLVEVLQGLAYGFIEPLLGWVTGLILNIILLSVLGSPIHNVLMIHTRRGVHWYVLMGVLSAGSLGLLFGAAVNSFVIFKLSKIDLASAFIQASPYGAVLALLFWLIRRPDRDASPLPSRREG